MDKNKVVVGVCLVRNCWKVYNDAEGTKSFIDRETAVQAATNAARLALAAGKEVNLYLEDTKGNFLEPPMMTIGH